MKLDAAYHSSLKKEAEAKSRTTAAAASCGTSLVDTSYWSSSSSSSEAESPSPLKCFVDVKAEEGDEEEKEGDGGARRKLHFSSATFEADEGDLAMEDIGGDAGGDSSAPSDQGNADGGIRETSKTSRRSRMRSLSTCRSRELGTKMNISNALPHGIHKSNRLVGSPRQQKIV